MKISLKWLQEYVDISNLTPQEIAKSLTDVGLEVESIEATGKVPDSVIVGRIRSAQKHPNAQTLQICEVDVGQTECLKIVCGASNAREGIFVCVASIGSVLPGDFKIKESKIRGELSQGMLCSGEELKINSDHDGIIELPEQKKLGVTVASVLGGDHLMELNITPNRGDCLGYLGIARELSAKLNRPMKKCDTECKLTQGEDSCPVEIKTEHCGRIASVVFRDVFPYPSPEWLKNKVISAGMRSINVLVDLTNLIMLECNQPVHAYDARQVKKLIVRHAESGEKLVTLDGSKLTLSPDDLVIADDIALGLAGVMGGQNTEIKDDTTDLVLEVAHFDAISVRKTAKSYALHSEASKRFERHVDIDGIDFVLRRFAYLLERAFNDLSTTLADVKKPKIGKIIDNYPKPRRKSVISLRPDRIKTLIGFTTIDEDFLVKTFDALGFKKIDRNAEKLVFEIPTWRSDIERECDLIEEYTRMYGLDKIPTSPIAEPIRGDLNNYFFKFLLKAKEAAASCGLTETIQFPFADLKDFENLNIPLLHPYFPKVQLSNAVSENENYLVTTLIGQLLKAVGQVRRSGREGVKLFEVGRGYFDFTGGAFDFKSFKNLAYLTKRSEYFPLRAKEDKRRFGEKVFLSIVVDSPLIPKTWRGPPVEADFFAGKEIVLQFARALGVSDIQFSITKEGELPFLHPKAAAFVTFNGKNVGFLGELHPSCYEKFDVENVVVMELDLEVIFESLQKNVGLKAEAFKFPPVERDLSWIVDKKMTHREISSSILGAKAVNFLQSINLFDIYTGEGIASDKMSVAYRFRFQSAEKTLTDAEIEKEMTKILEVVKLDLKGEIRC